jgi:hypothetical protein
LALEHAGMKPAPVDLKTDATATTCNKFDIIENCTAIIFVFATSCK